MKYMTFVAVSSFSSFAVLLRRTDVVTTENGQGHVNQCVTLTLLLRCSATSDSLNTALDSFSQGFKEEKNSEFHYSSGKYRGLMFESGWTFPPTLIIIAE